MSATRDLATVAISTVALAVSFYSVWDKRRDMQRQWQNRLNEIVDELNTITLEQQKLTTAYGGSSPDRHGDRGGLGGLYNDRRELLCREGVTLAELLGSHITDSHYRILATALERVGDKPGAEAFWRKAVEAAPRDSIFRLFVLRGHARYLFINGLIDRGRAVYQEAVGTGAEVACSDSDHRSFHTGWSYLQWAVSERNIGAPESEVQRLIDAAQHQFEQVIYRRHREDALEALDAIRDPPATLLHDARRAARTASPYPGEAG
ncbi:MAG: hypothetical protein QOI98_2970 [Solirubrobacteraceae bacterium]|nr:hypothetical protein [Solirubrobacteraceae bacterium]